MGKCLEQESIQQLVEHRFPRYDDLPVFGLYMDQVLSYVNDNVSAFYLSEEKLLTTSMVNNYVKQGVVPKPVKKKYLRDHVAYLMVICILKKVWSIPEVNNLVQFQIGSYTTPYAYDSFMTALELSIGAVFSSDGKPEVQQEHFTEGTLLVQRVVQSFANKVYVQKSLVILLKES